MITLSSGQNYSSNTQMVSAKRIMQQVGTSGWTGVFWPIAALSFRVEFRGSRISQLIG
jgi:hypothetical protein